MIAARSPVENFQRVGFLSCVPALLRALEENPASILLEAGLSPNTLDHPDNKIPHRLLGHLMHLASERAHCPHFGLEIGKQVSIDTLGPLLGPAGTLLAGSMRHAPTLRAALRDFAAHQARNARSSLIYLLEDKEKAYFGYVIGEQQAPDPDPDDGPDHGPDPVSLPAISNSHLSGTAPRPAVPISSAVQVASGVHVVPAVQVMPVAHVVPAVHVVPGVQVLLDAFGVIALNLLTDLASPPSTTAVEVFLGRPVPQDTALYARALHTTLHFNAGQTALAFPRRWLDHPIAGADPVQRTVFQHKLRAHYQPASIVNTLRTEAYLRRSLKVAMIKGHVSAPDIAAQFGMTLRTFQRHLHAAGLGFQNVLDQTRYQAARQLLANTQLTVAQITRIVGYRDPGALTARFTHWSGSTPSQWRATRCGT